MTSEVVCNSKNCKLFFFEASTIFYNSTVDRVKPKQHAQRGLQFEGSWYVLVCRCRCHCRGPLKGTWLQKLFLGFPHVQPDLNMNHGHTSRVPSHSVSRLVIKNPSTDGDITTMYDDTISLHVNQL